MTKSIFVVVKCSYLIFCRYNIHYITIPPALFLETTVRSQFVTMYDAQRERNRTTSQLNENTSYMYMPLTYMTHVDLKNLRSLEE